MPLPCRESYGARRGMRESGAALLWTRARLGSSLSTGAGGRHGIRSALSMTPTPTATLVARDWAEIQERMLVPLYEAVYERLEVGPGDRLLDLGCGAGLALLLAAARGA
ncbi:methyltransferase type 11, partial [Streptomyces sp. MBRL 10]